jgi:hypothetical protein
LYLLPEGCDIGKILLFLYLPDIFFYVRISYPGARSDDLLIIPLPPVNPATPMKEPAPEILSLVTEEFPEEEEEALDPEYRPELEPPLR